MNRIRSLLYVLLLAAASARGGTFTADFASTDTTTFILNGAGVLSDNSAWQPFIETNRLILTVNQNTLSGSFSPYDFDGGSPIESFTAKFKLQFGPGTTPPADGLSFSFGPDINQYKADYGEVGPGGSAFAVSFHTYTSNDGPSVDVYLYGQRIAHTKMPVGDMVNSQLQDVTIQLNKNSTLNVTYAGQTIYTNLYLPGWGPVAGFFIISARTGGSNEETDLANVNITTTPAAAAVAPTITANPQNMTVNEHDSASFSVAFDGTGPFTISWLENNNPIQDATNATLTLPSVSYLDNNAKITAQVSNQAGNKTSSAATLTVNRDTIAPTIVKTSGDFSFTAVKVQFSEAVSDTALSNSHYALDQGVTVYSVDRISPNTVRLTTSQMAENTLYTLTVNGVQDTAGIPNTIAANTKVQFRSFVFMSGTVLRSKYLGFPDNSRSAAVFADPRFGVAPDHMDLINTFEYPANGNGRDAVADPNRNYADTIEGYFIPATTGNYVFFTAGADYWALYLSTDADPVNKHLVCEVGGWTNPRGWNLGQPQNNPTTAPTDMTSGRSDTSLVTTWPDVGTISLTKGQRYYMMLLHTDPSWAGGDDFAATFKLEGEADPAPGDPPKLTGSLLGYYIDPDGASITFNQQPQSASTQEGGSVTFTVAATGVSAYGTNVAYQWQAAPKNSTTFTNIPGATAASYSTPPLTVVSDGMQFRVVANMPPISQNSDIATLTVSANTTPPVPTVGAMLDATAGTVDVGVGFDKPMDDASGSALANYSISSGTIVSLTWNSNRFTANSQNPLVMIRKQTALLKVTGLTGTSGTVTIKNVSDVYGNKITSLAVPFTVDTKMKWGVVGGNEPGGWNAVSPVTANGFDVYSDATGEWGNYDEATFVYEQVTGNFDKKLRVEYQDGSSQWARAGLVVRETTNFGVDRQAQTNGLAGRYQKCFVSPVGATLTGPGSAGAQDWELNRRLVAGGQTDGAPMTGANSIPKYPNAWCRIQRVGQTFTLFRSDDGQNWVTLGSTTWGVDDAAKLPMPDTLYVGPEFAPEIGNIAQAADRGTFLAQFRNYGDYVVSAPTAKLTISADSAGKVTITWDTGTLNSSTTVNGTYAPVQNAASPYVITPTSGGAMFYRVQ